MNQSEMGFRTAPLGFRREDVLEFIQEEAERVSELEEKIAHLQEENAQITREKQEAERAAQALIADHDRLMEEYHEKDQTIASLQSELQTAQDNCVAMGRELTEMKTQNAAMQNSLDSVRADHADLVRKCAEYDEARARLAEIELCAHARAEKVQEKAQRDACDLITEAEQMAERLLAAVERTKESYRTALSAVERETERAHTQSAEALDKFDEVMTGLRGRMSQVREHTEKEQQERQAVEHLDSKHSGSSSKDKPTLAQVLGALRGNK